MDCSLLPGGLSFNFVVSETEFTAAEFKVIAEFKVQLSLKSYVFCFVF